MGKHIKQIIKTETPYYVISRKVRREVSITPRTFTRGMTQKGNLWNLFNTTVMFIDLTNNVYYIGNPKVSYKI